MSTRQDLETHSRSPLIPISKGGNLRVLPFAKGRQRGFLRAAGTVVIEERTDRRNRTSC